MDCLEDAFKFGCNLNPIGMLGKGSAEEAGYVCGYTFSLQFGLKLQCLFSFVSAGLGVHAALYRYTVFSSAKRRLLVCLEFVLLVIMIICSAFKFRF